MELIILLVAMVALLLAMGAYKAPYFESRFQIYEELVTLFAQLLASKFNPQQLHKIEHLILRAKFLYNYDLDVLEILNKTRDYIVVSLEHQDTEHHQHEKETKKEQEMIRWIEQITSKHYGQDDKSELDKIFERYLKVSLLAEAPPLFKELSLKTIEFFKQLVGKLKS